MAVVNRDQLLLDVKFWLPANQTLSDTMITALNAVVITNIGDDDTFYKQILCSCIKAAARKLMTDYAVTSSGLKKEKTYMVEVEYYNTSTNPWEEYYLRVETDVCPAFGYVTPVDSSTSGALVTTIEYNNTLATDSTADCYCTSRNSSYEL